MGLFATVILAVSSFVMGYLVSSAGIVSSITAALLVLPQAANLVR